jgi:Trypsin-like peptidase domain
VRYLVTLLLSLVVAATATAHAIPDYRLAKLATQRIIFGDSMCSATAIEPNVILTAAHCVKNDEETEILPLNQLMVNGKLVKIRRIVVDTGDSALIQVIDGNFPYLAPIAPRLPKQGEQVFFWGNAAGIPNLFRLGYYMGTAGDDSLLFDFIDWHGDSGAGIFNSRGQLVAVVSGTRVWRDKKNFVFAPGFAERMRFTRGQLRSVGIIP